MFTDVMRAYSRVRPIHACLISFDLVPDRLTRSQIQNIALHSKKDSPDLDVEGWLYAIRRLPDNITSTYVLFFTTVIPAQLCQPSLMEKKIITAVRPPDLGSCDHEISLCISDRAAAA